MNFTCKQEDFARALQIVSRAVAARSTLPILSGILLEVEKDRLRCLGTDLELGIETTIPIENGGATARFVLPGRTLTDLAKRLSSGPVHFEVAPDARKVKLTAGRSVFNLNLLSAEDFPAVPHGDGEEFFVVSESWMRDAIRRTGFATIDEASRPFLSSILVDLNEGRIRLVATDINRLAMQEGKVTRGEATRSLMVPVRAMQEMARLLAGNEDEQVEIAVSDRQVYFRSREATLFSRLVQGKFPDYEQVVPKSSTTVLRVGRSEFESALGRVSLLVDSVKVIVTQGQLHLSASGPDLGEAYEDLEAGTEGSDLEIGFNARYLMDFLKAVNGETIEMRFGGSRAPVLMESPNDGDGHYAYVVMPMILGGDLN